MKNKFMKTISLVTLVLFFASCTKTLDRKPFYDVTSATVYDNFSNYKSILAKLYAGLAVSGQQGPSGRPDIFGIDEGFSSYLRQYWQLQELSSDEAVIGWNDGTIKDLHNMTWTPANEFIRMMYDRIFYQVSLCNEFLRETTDGKLSARKISGSDLIEAKKFRNEARFLRALSYYHAIDLFGNVPFVLETDPIGSFFPSQITRANLFAWLETELKELETLLTPARQNEYGRADQAAAWFLLAKLYLNASVYTGTGRLNDCIAYCNKIINSDFTLTAQYRYNFLADNHTSPELIFSVNFDGLRTKSWGAMTYLVHAPVGGNMNPAQFGINGGWGGLRTTKNIVNLFPSTTGVPDARGMFHTSGQNLEIVDISTFTDGYPITKYRNVTQSGAAGSDPQGNFPDTDFPLFRLADVYLIYAEAVVAGGSGGSASTALNYVNALRQRAYGNTSGNITATDLTLDFILKERARELNWEAHRRQDLIRFEKYAGFAGYYTGSAYVWPWKGGVAGGVGVGSHRTLYPIPSTDIAANPNLVQNNGY
jgi:hypothetical protein